MERPTCKTCPYFTDHGKDGTCHRLAPPPIHILGMPDMKSVVNRTTLWAVVDHEDWCGEHPGFPAYMDSLPAFKAAIAAKATGVWDS